MTRRVVLTVVTLTLLAFCSSGCARVGPALGISPGAGIESLDDVRLDADMAAIAASGATWVRLDFNWSQAEPEPGRYDWRSIARTVDAAHRHDLSVLALLTYSPSWAREPGLGGHAPPADPADFARFAGAAAEEFGSDVAAWEVWNEPNVARFWDPQADPGRYAELLIATSEAIRARHDGPVVTGGLSPAESDGEDIAPEEFLSEIYAAGAKGAFDAVGAHPYSFPALPSDPTTSSWNFFQRLGLLHDTMARHGDAGMQVWLTEFGAPTGTGDGAVDPELQSEIIADGLHSANKLPFVGPVFIYSIRDSGTDPTDKEQNFGVLRADGTPKPAWSVLSTADLPGVRQ